MKTLMLLSLMLFAAPAFGQEPAALEPIRVAITTQGEAPHYEELDKLLRCELQKRRDVVIATQGVKIDMRLAVAQIVIKGEPVGYVAALIVSTKDGMDTQSLFIGETLPALVELLDTYLNQGYLKPASIAEKGK